MALLEKLNASEENVARVAAVCRGEEVIPPLDEHEMLMLDAITAPHNLNKLGKVVLGRETITGSIDLGRGNIPTGTVNEDFINPTGLWLEYVPI